MINFLIHTIKVLTEQTLKKALHQLDTSECLIQWSIEHREFDIEHHPWKTLKGRVVVNFIVEFIGGVEDPQSEM
jgi:hypothetical protein